MPGDGVLAAMPVPPVWNRPGEAWPDRALYGRVIDAVHALPGLFESPLNIAGVRVSDLHTLNTTLGASIEQSVVDSLNSLRKIWDPDRDYELYSFVRQPQSFPDVRLQTSAPGAAVPVILGIELKGWFALAKEAEPSFRYKVTPDACAEADLLVVFPWVLSEVVSGTPRLLEPFVTGARYAAEHRNYYWRHMRGAAGPDSGVTPAVHRQPYPRKGDNISDRPARDSGGNFGRVARGGFMAEFTARVMQHSLAGIPVGAWQRFFRLFSDGETDRDRVQQIERIRAAYRAGIAEGPVTDRFDALREAMVELIQAARHAGD
jgi:hypothetical protein